MCCPCPNTTAKFATRRDALPRPSRRNVKGKALVVDMAPHADILAALQPPAEVTLAFSNLTPLAAVPECLVSLDEALQPAPSLAGTPRAALLTNSQEAWNTRLLSPSNSAKMEAAACLVSGGNLMVEESAADIVRATAAQLRWEAQARIRMRYATEVQQQLVRQRSWDNEAQFRTTRRRASLDERPEASQALTQLLEAQTHKNRLELEESRLLASPVEGIELEEPDHASLLTSCLASLDQPAPEQARGHPVQPATKDDSPLKSTPLAHKS